MNIKLLVAFLFMQVGFVSAWEFTSKNYTSKDFGAHPLIWNMIQDKKGNLWCANNNGVLRFDGSNWILFATPKPVRNMAFDDEGNLFVTCEGDIGVFTRVKHSFQYASFKDQMGGAKKSTLGDKNVLNIGGNIYYTLGKHILKVEKNKTGFQLNMIEIGEITGSFQWKNSLYINIMQRGLGVFDGAKWKVLPGGEILKQKTIINTCELGGKLCLATNYDGLYLWDGKQFTGRSNEFTSKGLADIATTDNATILGGFNEGVILHTELLTYQKQLALPSHEIFKLFIDHEKNLWVAHRKGLTHVNIHVPIKYHDELDLPSSATDILNFENTWIISSHAGLFTTDQEKHTLIPIKNIQGETWQLLDAGKDVLVASTNGLFAYNKSRTINVLPDKTILHIQKGKRAFTYYAFGSEYCYFLEYKNGNYLAQKLDGLDELANSVYEADNGVLWIGTYYNGLKLIPDAKIQIPEELKNGKVTIRLYKNKILVQGKQNFYRLENNQLKTDAETSELFDGILNQTHEIGETGLLYNSNSFLEYKNGAFVPYSFSYMFIGKPVAGYVSQAENVYVMEDKIFSGNSMFSSNNLPIVEVSCISFNTGSIRYDIPGERESILLPNHKSNCTIQFGIHSFIQTDKNKYRFKIVGLNESWSDWQQEGKITITGISPGKYEMQVDAKNAFGENAQTVFSFEVPAPWYQTGYAYTLYLLLVILVVILVIRINSKLLISQNRKLEIIVKERTRELETNNAELTLEKKKSDDLLLNILPEEVAMELKQSGKSKARQYANVSVLFTDFVNFTGISEQMSPTELVEEIHKNFTAFDAIMEKHGLEKIKTIGDAYLAVCGLPIETPDHAQRIIRAAIDIQQYIKNNSKKFEIRIGINSGPVIAGIVGVKKYAFDIWGDTVNTAARMEQNSEAGKINISGATFELIKNDFQCEYRGKVKAKNKGEIDMYFVKQASNNF